MVVMEGERVTVHSLTDQTVQKVFQVGGVQRESYIKNNTFFSSISSFAPNRLGPVLIESSGDSTTPRYSEHCQTPSELGDTPC